MDSPKSEFVVEVVRITRLEPHPNADRLSFARFETTAGPALYDVLVRTEDWSSLPALAVYVPVDSVVDTTQPEFAFLHEPRIRAARLRGVYSEGLLVPVRPGLAFGQNVAFLYGVKKHLSKDEKSELRRVAHLNAREFPKVMPDYGLDSFRRFGRVLEEGEEVFVTEKLHGMNARYVFTRGRFWVGSHHRIRGCTYSPLRIWLERARLRLRRLLGRPARTSILEEHGDVWWKIAHEYRLAEKLAVIPDLVVYGEIYGPGIQELHYDAGDGQRFRVFDFYDLRRHQFLDFEERNAMAIRLGLQAVPLLYVGPFGKQVIDMAEGVSTLNPKHVREGIVIKPVRERSHPKCGRVALKLVGQGYRLTAATE